VNILTGFHQLAFSNWQISTSTSAFMHPDFSKLYHTASTSRFLSVFQWIFFFFKQESQNVQIKMNSLFSLQVE